MPALLMKFFGESIGVLESYFYIGTVITLILCVFIAKELFRDLQEVRPQFAAMPKELAPRFERVYFLVQENRKKCRQVMDYVYNNYDLIQSTPTLNIYKLK